jgi:hypothetical protein
MMKRDKRIRILEFINRPFGYKLTISDNLLFSYIQIFGAITVEERTEKREIIEF